MRSILSLAALSFLLSPAAAQERSAMPEGDDCAFLVGAFENTYRGLREEEGKMDEADHHKVMMYLQIQSNTVQLAEAAGCDVRPMVTIAREQLERYDDKGASGRGGN
jgi:hypothetical protein